MNLIDFFKNLFSGQLSLSWSWTLPTFSAPNKKETYMETVDQLNTQMQAIQAMVTKLLASLQKEETITQDFITKQKDLFAEAFDTFKTTYTAVKQNLK